MHNSKAAIADNNGNFTFASIYVDDLTLIAINQFACIKRQSHCRNHQFNIAIILVYTIIVVTLFRISRFKNEDKLE